MANENFDIFAIIPKAAEMMRASWNSLTPEQKAQSLLSRPTRLPDIKVDQPAQPTVEEDSIIKGLYQRGNQRYFPEAQTFPYTKPEDITSELQYEREPLKETSKVTTDPTQEFIDVLKKVEGHKEPNFINKALGYATSTYQSPEDKLPMIGYGHKVTMDEMVNGIRIDDKVYRFKDVFNMTSIEAERLLRQDIRNAEKGAKSWFGDQWNKLNDIEQNAATELVFNMGLNKAKNFKEFKKKIIAKDKTWLNEINRTYTTPNGQVKPLSNRVNQLKTYFEKHIN